MESLTVVEERLQEFVTDMTASIERTLRDSSFNIYQPCVVLHRRSDSHDNKITLSTVERGDWKVFYAPEFCEVPPDMVFHMLCVQLYKAGYKERPQSACVEDGYPALVFDCLHSDQETTALLSRIYNKITSYMIGHSTDWRKTYTVYLEQPNEGQVFYMFCCRPDKAGSCRTWVVHPVAERTGTVTTDNSDAVDTLALQMVMLLLNKGYQVRRLYTVPDGLTIGMHRCKRLLEFTAEDPAPHHTLRSCAMTWFEQARKALDAEAGKDSGCMYLMQYIQAQDKPQQARLIAIADGSIVYECDIKDSVYYTSDEIANAIKAMVLDSDNMRIQKVDPDSRRFGVPSNSIHSLYLIDWLR